MSTIRLYKTYSFKTKDPVIDELRTLLKDSGLREREVAMAANLSVTTPKNWFRGGVRRPQSASVEAFGRAMGFKRTWTRVKMSKEE